MIKDESIQENMELDSDDEKQKSAQTIIDLDDDEMKDLAELRQASESEQTKSSQKEVDETAKNIFGGKNKK